MRTGCLGSSLGKSRCNSWQMILAVCMGCVLFTFKMKFIVFPWFPYYMDFSGSSLCKNEFGFTHRHRTE